MDVSHSVVLLCCPRLLRPLTHFDVLLKLPQLSLPHRRLKEDSTLSQRPSDVLVMAGERALVFMTGPHTQLNHHAGRHDLEAHECQ